MIKKWEEESNRERRERAEMSIMWRFQAATSNPPQSALPIDVAQLVAADGAWCECGGSDGTLPPRGRGSGGSHWLILMLEPLMIYLFGNYRALGELGTIDKETQERRGAWRFNASYHLSARLCILVYICVYTQGVHQKANSHIDISGISFWCCMGLLCRRRDV